MEENIKERERLHLLVRGGKKKNQKRIIAIFNENAEGWEEGKRPSPLSR